MTAAAIWGLYIGALVVLARRGHSGDVLLPGKVSVGVQAFAYVATYVSAVALVGFGGLCHRMGLQMLLVAAGNVWVGTWLVYRFLAWPTRLWQRRLGARTPAQLLGLGHEAPGFRRFLGLLSGILLVVYTSAVLKGAAAMLPGALPLTLSQAILLITVLAWCSVFLGGLRGVLFTEAFQGLVMVLGVAGLLGAVLWAVGGPGAGLRALAALPPTPEASEGFLAVSSGPSGLLIFSLMSITSLGVWAQPQMLQRHFALASRREARACAPLAVLVLTLVVGGTYFAGGLSRLLLPATIAPDAVVPTLAELFLPEAGRQLFALAVVSASLSTASALLHIAVGGFGEDLLGSALRGRGWFFVVSGSALASGALALGSSHLIATICATSWTLLASAMLVPYLMLVLRGRRSAPAAWASALGGLTAAFVWYILVYAPPMGSPTSLVPEALRALHPFFLGLGGSIVGWGAGSFGTLLASSGALPEA